MHYSSADRREHLVRPWGLMLMVISVLAVLALLAPRNTFLTDPEAFGGADALSVAYLQALLRANESNDELRMLYAEHLAAIGRLDRAERELARLENNNKVDPGRRTVLAMRLAIQRLVLSPGKPELVHEAERRLRQGFTASTQRIDPEQWRQIADLLLKAGEPQLAARVFTYLAGLDVSRRKVWLTQASRWYLAANQPLRAATLQMRLALEQKDAAHGLEAVRDYLAADRPDEAFKAVEKLIRLMPGQRKLVIRGLDLAMSHQRFDRGRAWAVGWLASHPEDRVVLQRLVRLELAANHPEKAYPWALKLVELSPESIRFHDLLARVSDWTGHPETAFRERRWLVAHRRNRQDMRRALFLADALHDYPAMHELLQIASRQYGLTKKESTSLARVLELLGEPRLSEKARVEYLRKHPEDRRAWIDLAYVREFQGKLNEAARTWKIIEKRFGRTEQTVIQRARLLAANEQQEKAFALTRAFARTSEPKSVEFWRIHGDLAWNLEYHADAFAAYRRLWDEGEVSSFDAQRLMILLREEGDYATVLRISEEAWRRFHDPNVLLLAIESAIELGHWKDVGRLIRIADSRPAQFRERLRYWLAHARWMVHRNRLRLAESDYMTALSMMPDNSVARTGLIWVWIQAREKKKLKHYLPRWRSDALHQEEYWKAYAAAYRSLGRSRASLPWFRRYARAHPGDLIWLAEYADALADSGHASGAWRLRRYIFGRIWEVVREGATEDLVDYQEALADLVQRFKGSADADEWVARLLHRHADPLLREFALRWYFARENHPIVAYWLLRRHARRLETPVWQAMALAMRSNDLAGMEKLLAQRQGLDHVSQLLAERQLLHLDHAWRLAMPSNLGTGDFSADERQTMFRQARDIQVTIPNAIHVGTDLEHFGALNLSRIGLKAFQSESNRTFFLRSGLTRLVPLRTSADLMGRDREIELQVGGSQRHRRGMILGYLGMNSRLGRSGWNDRLWQAGLNLQWQPWQGSELGIVLAKNEIGRESSAFRLIGARDRLGLSWNSDLTQREFVSAGLNLNRYFSRMHDALARGYAFDFSAGHRLQLANSLGEEQVRIRIGGEWVRNRLSASMGDYAMGILRGVTLPEIVPPSYSSFGIGLGINRDRPGNDEAVARTPSYEFDAWVGWQSPGGGLAYNLSMGVGFPVLGRDMLGLRGYLANSLAGSLSRESLYGAGLWYSYRFGK